MSNNVRNRRKMERVPGSDFTVSEYDVAVILKQTYAILRNNHKVNQRISSDRAQDFKVASVEDQWAKTDDNVEAFKNENDKNFWLELAQAVLTKRLDPRMFIRRQFMLLSRTAPSPAKEKLVGKRAFANYEAGKEMSRKGIAVAFRTQKDTARSEIVNEQDEDCDVIEASVEVLWDFELSLSALFRYCLALQLLKQYKDSQFQELADSFRVVAALQYVEDPEAYDIVWGRKWLPVGFRSEAATVYNKVYGV